jgi:protein O-mannosyl-transferase
MRKSTRRLDRTKPAGTPKAESFFFRDSRSRTALLALLLIVATVAVYYQVHDFSFLHCSDDDAYVVHNRYLAGGLNALTFRFAIAGYYSENWHPLTWLSHALDIQLYGLDSGAHHVTSIIWHLANVLLVFWVLRRATGYVGRSLMVAALFALHPINVESVAWVAERKTVLSAFFFLLALGTYRWYASKPGIGRYVVVFLLYACGLMSKAQVIVFPVVLLLWDYWPLGRMFPTKQGLTGLKCSKTFPAASIYRLVIEKVPLLFLTAIAAAITMQAQSSGEAVVDIIRCPPSLRAQNVVVSYVRYVTKACWPSHLSAFYPFPTVWLSTGDPTAGYWEPWRVVASTIFLLVVTFLVFLMRHRARYLLVGWLWFLGMLVPMIGIVQVGSQSMANRYAYLSFLGLFIIASWGVSEWARRRGVSMTRLAVPSVLILMAMAACTYLQIGYWRDTITLLLHTEQVIPKDWQIEYSLGIEFSDNGQQDQALSHLRSSVELNPSSPLVIEQIAWAELLKGDWPKATDHYEQALALLERKQLAYPYMTPVEKYYYHSMRDEATKNLSRLLDLSARCPGRTVGEIRRSRDYLTWSPNCKAPSSVQQFGVDRHSYYEHPELQP